MEENVLLPKPGLKLYKDSAIYIGTFLGGPLVAGYLAAENFKQLGQKEKVTKTWLIAIVVTIVIFGGVFLIPGIEKIPNYIIPLAYTLVAQLLIQRFQGAAVKAQIAAGGQTYTAWRAVWIGLVGLVILLAIIFVILFFTDKELFQ